MAKLLESRDPFETYEKQKNNSERTVGIIEDSFREKYLPYRDYIEKIGQYNFGTEKFSRQEIVHSGDQIRLTIINPLQVRGVNQKLINNIDLKNISEELLKNEKEISFPKLANAVVDQIQNEEYLMKIREEVMNNLEVKGLVKSANKDLIKIEIDKINNILLEKIKSKNIDHLADYIFRKVGGEQVKNKTFGDILKKNDQSDGLKNSNVEKLNEQFGVDKKDTIKKIVGNEGKAHVLIYGEDKKEEERSPIRTLDNKEKNNIVSSEKKNYFELKCNQMKNLYEKRFIDYDEYNFYKNNIEKFYKQEFGYLEKEDRKKPELDIENIDKNEYDLFTKKMSKIYEDGVDGLSVEDQQKVEDLISDLYNKNIEVDVNNLKENVLSEEDRQKMIELEEKLDNYSV